MAKRKEKRQPLVIDFERFCRDQGIEFLDSGHHHCSTGWVQIHCPYCAGGSYGYHMGYSLDNGNFHCWRCGGHSRWDVFSRVLRTSDYSEIGRVLSKYQIGDTIDRRSSVDSKQKPRKRTCPEPPDLKPLQSQHKKYLRRRGFDPDKLEEVWDVKGTGRYGQKWKWRVVAPVKDRTGHVCAYNGRIIRENTKPKYLFTPDSDITMDPDLLLYGIEKADIDKSVVIVEGMTDVWRLMSEEMFVEAGLSAVATFGIDWTVEQADILSNFKRRIVLFDAGKLAQKQAMDLARWLAVFPGNTDIVTEIEKDPGDWSQSDIGEFVNEFVES